MCLLCCSQNGCSFVCVSVMELLFICSSVRSFVFVCCLLLYLFCLFICLMVCSFVLFIYLFALLVLLVCLHVCLCVYSCGSVIFSCRPQITTLNTINLNRNNEAHKHKHKHKHKHNIKSKIKDKNKYEYKHKNKIKKRTMKRINKISCVENDGDKNHQLSMLCVIGPYDKNTFPFFVSTLDDDKIPSYGRFVASAYPPVRYLGLSM